MTSIASPDDKSSPFGHAAALYRSKRWPSTIPLRPNDKRPWLGGYHGGNNPYPDDATIADWCVRYSKGNIGLRLGEVQVKGKLYEIVGLDIDHYESNGKVKRGGDTLAKLEEELGKLSDLPISSARSDGISGIRFFLVPAGLHWYDAGPDFQVIWKGNRYAVAWPSIHPDLLTMYLWYLTGCKPDGNGNDDVPDATALPFLPQPWIDYLTDRNKPFKPDEIDSSSDEEIISWAKAQFNDGSAEAMCSAVRFARDKWVKSTQEEGASYPNITGAYWEIPHLAAEGHTGWNAAIEKVGETYFDVVSEERHKRPSGAVYSESRRALLGTLKKIKPKIESGELVTTRDPSGECPWCYPGPEILEQWNKNMTTRIMLWPPPTQPQIVAEKIASRVNDYEHPLLYWKEQWFRYTGAFWKPVSEQVIDNLIRRELKDAHYWKPASPAGKIPPHKEKWNPNMKSVADVLKALRSVAYLDDDAKAPCWIEFDGERYIRSANQRKDGMFFAFPNCLLRIGIENRERKMLDATPEYFNLFALDFEYDPNAPKPAAWKEQYLDGLLPGDIEAQQLFEEWIGYVISGRKDLHTMLMIIGPLRSGKGTYTNVLIAFVGGLDNVAAMAAKDLSTNFGMQPIVHPRPKVLGVITDHKVSINGKQLVETLVRISGDDPVQIDIKHKGQYTGKPPTRLTFMSNEVPALPDSSQAIRSRFKVVRIRKSFEDDPNLDPKLFEEKLKPVLPGIFNRVLDALDRLTERGYFVQPKSGEDSVELLREGASKIEQFLRNMCDFGPEHRENKGKREDDYKIELGDSTFSAWSSWCRSNGHNCGSKTGFRKQLDSLPPTSGVLVRRIGPTPAEQVWCCFGVRWKRSADVIPWPGRGHGGGTVQAGEEAE